MLGIKGYEPQFNNNVGDIIKKQGAKLKDLVGKKISHSWVMWDIDRNEWWSDCPVVLQIGDSNLELCAFKFDEYAITFDTIDISEKPNWYDMDDINLHWKIDALPQLVKSVSKTIKAIDLLEYKFTTTVLESKDHPESVGNVQSGWLLNGIGFDFDDLYLSVYNALDQNGVSDEKETGETYRTTRL